MTEKKDKPSPEPPKREPQTLREELENSLVEYLMPYSDTLIQVQERFTQFAVTVGAGLVELQKQMKPFLEGFQAVVHKLAQVDWTAVIDAHEKSSIHIADCGWTMPGWIGLSEFYTLYGKSQDELDRYFTDGFMENEGENLKALGERLSHMQSLSQWHPLLEDIVASILAGRHYVAIPATLTVMEGYLSNALVKASLVREGNTIPFKALEKAKWHEQDTFDAILWRGGVRFLSRIFADSDFTQQPPTFVNRHWILHGRAPVDWTVTDALRLVNCLTTLEFLFETVGKPRPDSPKRPHSHKDGLGLIAGATRTSGAADTK